ncbi:MAG: class I SAM-dependent methyltransferase [Verrucomicrobiota bacterium]|nr:class I SAM-dependent methyltransferase [Verrucomicrobiota bacterium]
MTKLIVTWSVQRFRRLAKELPNAEDSVLEIGCSTGGTTRCLAGRCARVVAVDLGAEVVKNLQAELAAKPNVTVARVDGRDAARLRSLLPDPDLIFLDIGGTALLGNIAVVLRECLQAFMPQALVVRNTELATVGGADRGGRAARGIEFPPD